MQDIKAVFDIGNGRIKGIVFAQDEGKTVVLVKDMIKTKGLRKGKLLDMEEFVSNMNTVIEGFVKKLGGDYIDEVCVTISHPELLRERLSEQKRIMGETVGEEDVAHLSKVIGDLGEKNNHEIIKIIPVFRTLDEVKKEKNPLGLQAKRLELTADIFALPKTFYGALTESFQRLSLNVVDIVPNILASAEGVLDFDHKDLGTLLIDIGNNQTSYVVYEDGYPLRYGTLPVGGEDVTKDISIALQIDIKEAENIKKEKGYISSTDYKPEITGDESIDIHYLSDVITARYEQIFTHINKQLRKIDRDGRLPGGVLLIGGGTKMQNCDQCAKEIFKLATFFGKEYQLSLGELSSNLQFINALGGYLRTTKYNEAKSGFFGFNFNMGGGIFQPITNFFKKLF